MSGTPYSIKYRSDIDGLRAIAVLSVVAYHAFPDVFKGGFIGVDIFFVISGYLISTIILQDLKGGAFSFKDFYIRRIRRIFPALCLVLSATFIVGWLFLFPDELQSLGKHILSGASFFSNLVLWSESGYFDAAAETKPLLHLWSLGIEEQFYLIWPMLLYFGWKRRWNAFVVVSSIGIGSFALNIYLIGSDPIGVFFSPVTRFWELLVGAFLACIAEVELQFPGWQYIQSWAGKKHYFGELRSFLGLVLLLIALFEINKQVAFPGFWALLPTLGTFFIISASPGCLVNRYVLSAKPLVWIGLISYPLYLWHWPILSFLNIGVSGYPQRIESTLAVLLSFILAFFTYRFVERPLRFGHSKSAYTFALIAAMTLIFSAGLTTYLCDGMPMRFQSSKNLSLEDSEKLQHAKNRFLEMQAESDRYTKKCDFYNFIYEPNERGLERQSLPPSECFAFNPDIQNTVFLWGDSHAEMLHYGLSKNLPQNWQLLQVARADCGPRLVSSPRDVQDRCASANNFALKAIETTMPKVVMLGQRNHWSDSQIQDLTNALKKLGVKKIIFYGKSPEWYADLPKIVKRKMDANIPRYSWLGLNQEAYKKNLSQKNNFSNKENVMFFDIYEHFCNDNGCMVYLGEFPEYGLTSPDTNHLSPIASEFLAKKSLVKLLQ